MKDPAFLLILLVVAGCGGDRSGQLRATLTRPPRDTIRFTIPATAIRCEDRRSLLLQAVSPDGYGFMVRLRYGDSLSSGSYAVTAMNDTTEHIAMAAARYLVHQVIHMFSLDTGNVEVRQSAGKISAHIEGHGVESAALVSTIADYSDLAIEPQSTPCLQQL